MKPNSVLFLQRSVPPDSSAAGRILMEMATALAHRGWKVDILATRVPTDAAVSECVDGVQIQRVKALPFTRKSLLRRAAALASVYPVFLGKAVRLKKPDVVVSLTDPPLLSVIANILCGYWKVPHVHWAQDVYPETAIQLGVLKEGTLPAQIMKSIAHGALRKAQSIIVIGRCMEKFLRAKGMTHLREIPNWTDLSLIYPDENAGEKFRKNHDLSDKFVIFYIGNLGLAHGLEWFLETAALLKERMPDACFVFAGNGPRRAWLIEQIRDRKIENIRVIDSIGKNDLAAAYSAADLHITTLDSRLQGLVVPSKIYAALASGRPCAFIGPAENEAAQVILDAKAGAAFSPQEKDAFINFAESCKDPAARKYYGENAFRKAQTCTLENAVTQFEAELLKVTCRGKTPPPGSSSAQFPNPESASNA
ncbi:MAG: glycosyltransferase family 4 protein [Chthoniobacterales bacterium]